VVFRLDDIQDHFLDHVQLEVMSLFEEKREPDGWRNWKLFWQRPDDSELRKRRVNGSSFEVANHGWNDEDFTTFGMEEQSALTERTNSKISYLLGIEPVVFIAPYNIINGETFADAKENGIRYISANVTYDPPPYDITSNQSLYRLPETALMGDLNDDDTYWITFSHRKVLNEIEYSLDQHGFAEATMHLQDFAIRDMLDQNTVDSEKIEELEILLDRIHEKGIEIVAISEIRSYVAQEAGVYVQTSLRPSREEEVAAG
jgi:peptidoglycan/xylan/chitin deacetylase (PgdA/CDA1 family)